MKQLTITILSLAALSSVASADVLIDTMGMIDTSDYNTLQRHNISGMGILGFIQDWQVADDFDVPGLGYAIDSVEGGFLSWAGNPPAEGAWVQFYEDLGGQPAEAVFADYLATGSEVTITPFEDLEEGLFGMRIGADLSASGIVLPAGTWWVDIQPIDTTPMGDLFFSIGIFDSNEISYYRDGSEDHGNSYDNPSAANDWTPYTDTKAFRVDGTPVPEPASALLLVLAALPLMRRKRLGR